MRAQALKAELKDIEFLRRLFLQESNFQIRYEARHHRGWTDSYVLKLDDVIAGYGAIAGRKIEDRDTVFEFFVVKPFRNRSSELFRELLAASGARYIECQSNDFLLSSMLFEFSKAARADVILFEDFAVTEHIIPGVHVRPSRDQDQVFQHSSEPVGEYVLEFGNEVVATGGFLLHYNMPFADLYMEVREDCRRRGFGSFLLQEVKKHCYLAGRIPAARCDLGNTASRATLIKAGLRVCGFMLMGKVKPPVRVAGH
jgi:GNAT superfamily N-acetyltransferase